MQQTRNITNLRKFLEIVDVATTIVRIIFSIDLLHQFQITKLLKKKKKRRHK